MVLLLSIAFTPLNIFLPIFLQKLHGFDPLAAGYTVAGTSMAWTVAAVLVAGLSPDWSARMIVGGPLVKAAGLLTLAAVLRPKLDVDRRAHDRFVAREPTRARAVRRLIDRHHLEPGVHQRPAREARIEHEIHADEAVHFAAAPGAPGAAARRLRPPASHATRC